jgi:hypothetical protein
MSAKQTLRQWLASGETAKVVDALLRLVKEWGDSHFSADVTHQAGRYNGLEKDRHKGILDDQYYTQQLNAIRIALQYLIERLPDTLELPNTVQTASTTSPAAAIHPAAPAAQDAKVPAAATPVNPHIPWVVGLILLLGAAIVLVVFVPCPTKPVENIFRLLMALGAAGIATLLPGLFHLELTWVKAGSALGVFTLVYLINPAGVVKDNSGCQDFSTITVVVHGAGGAHQKILRGQGEMVIEFAQKTEKARINEEGEAIFLKIPTQWLLDPVKIYLEHPQPYQALQPDSLYRIPAEGKVYVAAGLQHADRLFGTITDARTNDFLDSVRVSVRNIAAYSDKNGWFELRIPPDIQHKFQRVTLSKPGYETVVFDSIPFHTQQEFSYALTKSKK